MVASKNMFSSLLAIVVMVFMVGCSGSSSSGGDAILSVKSVVYDNNITETVADDTAYIYFNKSIDSALLGADSNLSSHFDVYGGGAIGDNIISDYDDNLSRLKITMNNETNNSLVFIPGSTIVSLSLSSTLARTYPLGSTPVTVTAFRTIPQIGETTYTEDNGTVRDDFSRLIWEQEDDNAPKTWDAAKIYCEDLSKDGLTWRLPTIDELLGLVDRGGEDPAISSIEFTNTDSANYWSSTDYLDTPEDDAWSIYFKDGATNTADKNVSLLVRCVESSSGVVDTVNYIRDDLKEIVLATSTNLMWQDTAENVGVGDIKTYDDAIFQCSLPFAGESDWRLPSFNELNSIADKSRIDPAINPIFKNTRSSRFWTSTEYIPNTDEAWHVDFGDGSNHASFKDLATKYNVRCVRTID